MSIPTSLAEWRADIEERRAAFNSQPGVKVRSPPPPGCSAEWHEAMCIVQQPYVATIEQRARAAQVFAGSIRVSEFPPARQHGCSMASRLWWVEQFRIHGSTPNLATSFASAFDPPIKIDYQLLRASGTWEPRLVDGAHRTREAKLHHARRIRAAVSFDGVVWWTGAVPV